MDCRLPRGIYNVRLMTAVTTEYGMSTEQCLRGSGIEAASMYDSNKVILSQQELVVVDNIIRALTHMPDIALHIGRRFHMSVYGALAFAMCSCATVGEGFALGMRYPELGLSMTNKKMFMLADGLIAISLDATAIPQHLRAFVIARDMSALIQVLREIFGDNPVRRIGFNFPRPAYADQLKACFGIEPEYSAACNFFAMDAAVLNDPMPQADPQARLFWEREVAVLAQQRRAQAGVAGRVRDILLSQLEQAPDMELVAATFNVSSRTLRRLLTAEQTSYRELIDDVRVTMAENLLASTYLPIEEVSSRLGFMDVSGFITAFKRWKGLSPSHWRSMQRTVSKTYHPVRTFNMADRLSSGAVF